MMDFLCESTYDDIQTNPSPLALSVGAQKEIGKSLGG
jgi:hypothetical protein